eukprot:TRINITY_DN11630_c0_g1_i3.p1 TRINITY_DN11630_c0_g1~~TRINITY_DN11630_c0_g1_i3.p1  ORF type:complete len:246 (-),score=45.37 TRINITY_DN11630_c0_g1_i3:83-820(-)
MRTDLLLTKCFEEILVSMKLPCSCKVAYCVRCWDRSLAESLHHSGHPRCPTCRMPVRVDFDPEKGALAFTLESRQAASICVQTDVMSLEHLRIYQQRLTNQAKPVQLRLLQEHFSALPEALQQQSDAAAMAAQPDQVHAQPKCVCGWSLEWVSSHERARRFCQMVSPQLEPGSLSFEHLLAELSRDGCSYCDLCDSHIGPDTFLLTCKNGNRSLIHSNAFDICAECFFSSQCTADALAPMELEAG